MIEKALEEILEKMKCNRWEQKQIFLTISMGDLKDMITSIKQKANIRLTSISVIEYAEYFEFFYHLIVDDVPLNISTKVSKGASFQSIKDIIPNATFYEEELQRIFEKRG